MSSLWKSFLIALLGWAILGCSDDDDDEVASPTMEVAERTSVPRIGGRWKGTFFRTDESGSEPVSATIRQMGDALDITTNRSEPPGQRFMGGIDADGDITLTDAFDGEIWTTHFGPATSNFVKIADFIRRPDPAATNAPPLNVIELRR